MNIGWTIGIVSSVGFCFGMTASVAGHIYPDGFVERSIAITVGQEAGHGEILIGLNANTAASILADAQSSQALDTPQPDKRPASVPAAPGSCEQTDLVPADGKSTDRVTKSAIEELPASEKFESANAAPPSATKVAQAESGPGQHLTDPQAIDHLAAVNKYWLINSLTLTLNGRPVPIRNIQISPAARHPYSMRITFDFSTTPPSAADLETAAGNPETSKVPTASPTNKRSQSKVSDPAEEAAVNFQLDDNLFPSETGAVRYSLRTRGASILLSSNVAPTIIRAQRYEFDQPRASLTSDSFKIQAKIVTDP